MNLVCLFAVFATGVFCGDMGVSPAEAAMRRIIDVGRSIEHPDVQWLMKQTDLLLIFVSQPFWRTTMEERHNFISVIEHFVLAAISGPLGGDIREAAAVFHSYSISNSHCLHAGELSVFASWLAHDLATNAPSLPTLLSDPDFPMDTDRRILLASIESILMRLNGSPSFYFRPMYQSRSVWSSAGAGYLEMLLDVFTKVEDRYTRLCQQTGVDVQHTYRPMMYLNRYWGNDVAEDTKLVQSIILPMIDDPQTIEFAKKVGLCLDFARTHFSFMSFAISDKISDPDVICRQLITRGVNWSDYHASRFAKFPKPLPDLPDTRAPMPMESADARTIRVTRLVEVVALTVPEIREIFPLIHGPASMFKFERILWKHLDQAKRYPNEGVGMDRLAYKLVRLLGIRILHLPMIRERYFKSLSLEQFEGFRRIISCMARLEPLLGKKRTPLAGSPYEPEYYIRYALQHPNEIALMSRGLEALTRLYKKFQQDPIWSGEYNSVARQRTVVRFLPAYLVFCILDIYSEDRGWEWRFDPDVFRHGLEWVIAHESAFLSRASLSRLVAGDRFCLDDPMDTVLQFLGGSLSGEFDKMVSALGKIVRELESQYTHGSNNLFCWSIAMAAVDIPTRILAAVSRYEVTRAIEAPLRAQVLRIVPVFTKLMRAVSNGQLHSNSYAGGSNGPTFQHLVYRIHSILYHLSQYRILNSRGIYSHEYLEQALDSMEKLIPPPQTNLVI